VGLIFEVIYFTIFSILCKRIKTKIKKWTGELSKPDMEYYQGKDLFKGTAWYYARYRPAYPAEVFQLIRKKFGLNGSGCLLDLGCGPGDLAIPLAQYFEKVVALDTDGDMLDEGRQKAAQAGTKNIQWVYGKAEEMPDDLGPFKLVTIGRAFHWMEQKTVLERVIPGIKEGGGLALVGESGRIWQGGAAWQAVVREVIQRYLGKVRRAGNGTFKVSGISWEDLLKEYFPQTEYVYTIPEKDVWNYQTLTGYLYSTSFCSRELLGEQVTQFEEDLKSALLALEPLDYFEEEIPISVMMGWKNE
jgi:ubiquinone/menaquinone biosynthesis C-methylase UbiE